MMVARRKCGKSARLAVRRRKDGRKMFPLAGKKSQINSMEQQWAKENIKLMIDRLTPRQVKGYVGGIDNRSVPCLIIAE